MDVRYINPFIHAIRRVFETMVHTTVTVSKPSLRHDGHPVADVSGIIGLSGDVSGSVALSFPREVACAVASAFAGAPIRDTDADFADALGELANMVAGSAKTHFAGLNVSISLPSVVMGHDLRVLSSRTFPRIVIPCETGLGSVYVDVAMRMERAASATPAAAAAGVGA